MANVIYKKIYSKNSQILERNSTFVEIAMLTTYFKQSHDFQIGNILGLKL